MPPAASSFSKVLALASATQTLLPSYRIPATTLNPRDTVVTVQGMDAVGVTIETDPEPGEKSATLVVQIRAPSNAARAGAFPRLLATVVTAPAGWLGSMR